MKPYGFDTRWRRSAGHADMSVPSSDTMISLQDWRQRSRSFGARTFGIAWPGCGTTAEAAVDSFLHDNVTAESGKAFDGYARRRPSKLDLAQLAQTFYACSSNMATTALSVDALHREFSQRVSGSRSLILMFESLYPVVWQYFEANDQAASSLPLRSARNRRCGLDVQTVWAALTQANRDRLALQQDAGSREKQVTSLRSEVSRLEEDVKVFDQTSQDLRYEVLRLREDVSASEAHRALTEAENRDKARAAEQDNENERLRRAEVEARLAALYGSTSWRLTKPLRAIARAFRGSS